MKIKQVVILGAGDGTRLWPLGEDSSKILSPVLGTSVLEKKLSLLSSLAEEAVLIVGAGKDKIISRVGEEHEGMRIKYVEQKERLGTGHALKAAEKVLKERFLVLNGDDVYGREGIEKILSSFPAILVKEVDDVSQFGAVLTKNGEVKDLIEKPKKQITNLANIGVYFIPKSILSFNIGRSERGEYEITDYIKKFAQKESLYCCRAKCWLPLSYPWHLLDINTLFSKKLEKRIEGEVEEGVTVKGEVVIGKEAVLKSGTYVEGPAYIGPGCEVGPNSYIRPFTVLKKKVKIGQAVEVKASIIGEGSRIAHLSYVGDSVIGKNCNLGAGTVTANLRFDGKNVRTKVKGRMVDSGRRKLGAVLGNGVKTGINVSLMPGVLIASGSVIMPGKVVSKNID